MGDLVFYGGPAGAFMGNQQFTSRNLSFYDCVQAINQIWDWGMSFELGLLAVTDAIQAGPTNPLLSAIAVSD